MIVSLLLILCIIISVIIYLFISSHTDDYEQLDNDTSNVILTVYLNSKQDYQRNIKWPSNDYSKIKMWYESINKKPGLHGIIFVDSSADKDFIDKYTTKNISFVRVPNLEDDKINLNEYRFKIYYDFLMKNSQYKNIFMTDGSDVEVVQNPFTHEIYNPDTLFSGEEKKPAGTVPFYASLNEDYDKNRLLYNAGIVGGSRHIILKFLTQFNDILNNGKPVLNKNMAIFNDVLHDGDFKIKSGYPLHSIFTKYEKTKDVIFIHK